MWIYLWFSRGLTSWYFFGCLARKRIYLKPEVGNTLFSYKTSSASLFATEGVESPKRFNDLALICKGACEKPIGGAVGPLKSGLRVWMQVSECARQEKENHATSWPTSPSSGGSWTSRRQMWPVDGTVGTCWALSPQPSRRSWSSSSQSSAQLTEISGSVSAGITETRTAAQTAPHSTTGQMEAHLPSGGWEILRQSRRRVHFEAAIYIAKIYKYRCYLYWIIFLNTSLPYKGWS